MPNAPLNSPPKAGRLTSLLTQSPFLRFLIVGVINTVFGYSVFALLVLAGLHYALAVGIATIAGVFFNFKTIGALVFRNQNNRRIFRFIGVYLVVYGINVLVIRFATAMGIEVLIAGAVAIFPVALLSYTMNRIFVFGVTG
jgi:putative flippase GtrA